MGTSADGGLVSWFARNPVAANLLMLAVIFVGIVGIIKVPLELFPSFPPESFVIEAPYPGGSPVEIEKSILIKIEEEIRDIDGIDEIRSIASSGSGKITVRLYPGTDLDPVVAEAKLLIDTISSFPAEAEEIRIIPERTAVEIIRLSAYGDMNERQLFELAHRMRNEILEFPRITQVSVDGVRDYEVSIELSHIAMQRFQITIDDVVAAISSQSRNIPGGSLRTFNGLITLRADGQSYTGEDFDSLVLINRDDGTVITLGDVAIVKDSFQERPVLSRINGQRSATLHISSLPGQSPLDISRSIQDYAEKKTETLPAGVSLLLWSDQSRALADRMDMLGSSALQGAILVAVVLGLFLHPSLAFWVILGIPFSFLGAMGTIWLLDIPVSINLLSLFGFILVLGILVDDGIVTAESAYSHLQRENQGIDSIIKGVRRVATVTIFGAMTSMIAFLPFMLLDQGLTRMMSHMPPVIILCLAFSLLETKLILPAHLRHISTSSDSAPVWTKRLGLAALQQRFSQSLRDFSEQIYGPLLRVALAHRAVTIALFISTLISVVSLVSGGVVRFIPIPQIPAEFIEVVLELPEGAPWRETHAHALSIQGAVAALNEHYRADTGENVEVVTSVLVSSNSDNVASIIIELTPSSERSVSSIEMIPWLRREVGELSGIQSLRYIANGIHDGGLPVDVELSSSDLQSLTLAADELQGRLSSIDGLFDLSSNLQAGGTELDIQVKPEGSVLGLRQAELARQIRNAIYGAEVQRFMRGQHEIRVFVRLPLKERESLKVLENLWISLPDGRRMPFSQVASVSRKSAVSNIVRFDGKRVANVTADLDRNRVLPGQVYDLLTGEIIPELERKYPGLKGRLSGDAEMTAELGQALGLGLSAVLFGIYFLLAVPLKSYLLPLVIMSVIPFSIIGVVIGHGVFNVPISFMSIVGGIALFGIIINDGLVLVDEVSNRVSDGVGRLDALVDGGVVRFRAVVLTSVTTFVGLLPVQLDGSLQADFIKPMALSLGFGMLFGIVITLFLLPVLYSFLKESKTQSIAD